MLSIFHRYELYLLLEAAIRTKTMTAYQCLVTYLPSTPSYNALPQVIWSSEAQAGNGLSTATKYTERCTHVRFLEPRKPGEADVRN
jgi:hypothetical protein